MELTVNQRVQKLISTMGLSVNSFAKKINITQSTIASMFSKGTQPSVKTINAIIDNTDVNKEWLLTGEGEMLKSGSSTVKTVPTGLPLLPYSAMAGVLSGSDLTAMEYECEHYIVPAFHNADFLVRVQGDSMVPRYYSGDIVACKKIKMDKLFFQWGKTYVINTNQGILIKRIDPGKQENCVSIVSYNNEYQTFQLPIEDINQEGIALVVGLLRIE